MVPVFSLLSRVFVVFLVLFLAFSRGPVLPSSCPQTLERPALVATSRFY